MTGVKKNKCEAASYGGACGSTNGVLKRSAIIICMLFLLAVQVACNEQTSQSASSTELVERYKRIWLGDFSPDGKKLALTYCKHASICKTGIYDIRLKSFSELVPQDTNQVWTPGGFSPDGSRLAVTIQRKSEGGSYSQIGILDLKTLKLTEITSSYSYKSSPSFSRDNKKIIFAQSNRERQSGKTRFSDWDIYEININVKQEKRLTFWEFYSVSSPAYLPDNRRFIFSGEGPRKYLSPSGGKGYDAYQQQFKGNEIFVLSPDGEQRLTPFFTNQDYSSLPAISLDGKKIVYTARTNKLDGIMTRYTYDVFLFDGKNHKRLTQLDSLVADLVISPKGDWVAYVKEPHQRIHTRELELLNINEGHVERIDPWTAPRTVDRS